MTPIAHNDLTERMSALPDGLAVPEPHFEFELGAARRYPDALAGDTNAPVEADSIVGLGARSGRVIVLGNGGVGKTSLMSRLWSDARERGDLPVWVDLRSFTDAFAGEEWPDQDDERAEMLLGRLGHPAVTPEELDLLDPAIRPVILIDGLNEVPNQTAETIASAATYIARRHPQATVVATDRLVRRLAVDGHWTLVRLLAVHLHGQPVHEQPLLREAFWLNLMLGRTAGVGQDEPNADRFLRRHVGLGDEEITAAQQAAAEAYRGEQSRSFDLAAFSETAGDTVVDKLRTAGTLVDRGGRAHFAHQLIHDWLAAGWLAGDEDRWTHENFDALSFSGSSFDAIALALDRLDDPAAIDRLVRGVYDWNYYGAAYVLARARALGRLEVTSTMTVALVAMLGERQWDPIVATVDRVKDALSIVKDPMAERMLGASGPGDVRRIVAQQPPHDELFKRWTQLFATADGASASDEMIDALDDDDSLIGWTAANVLRRATPDVTVLKTVVSRLADRASVSPVIRWRAAHVLGGWSAPAGHQALLDALAHDPHLWVRYGAVRSIVDNAANDAKHRHMLISAITERLDELRDGPGQVLVELERSMLRRPAPAGWVEAVADLVELAYASAPGEDEAQRWRRLATELARSGGG